MVWWVCRGIWLSGFAGCLLGGWFGVFGDIVFWCLVALGFGVCSVYILVSWLIVFGVGLV